MRARKWFFFTHRRSKKLILHICGLASGFFIHTKEGKKWYCTLPSPWVIFLFILHLWSCKWFLQLTQNKKMNDIAYLRAHKWFPSKLVSNFFDLRIKRKEMTFHTLVKKLSSVTNYLQLKLVFATIGVATNKFFPKHLRTHKWFLMFKQVKTNDE